MGKIVIGRSLLDAARERCALTNAEQEQLEELLGTTTGMLTIELDDLPINFLRSLLEDNKRKPNQRAVLAPYEYDELAITRLYLPRQIKDVLTRVFETPGREPRAAAICTCLSLVLSETGGPTGPSFGCQFGTGGRT